MHIKKSILITGVAGFIGFSVAQRFLKLNWKVFGVDNLNNYYSVSLKKKRIIQLKKISNKKFFFFKIDIKNRSSLEKIFRNNNFDIVLNLAAQAGVRYSLVNPKSYIESNLMGFFNVIDLSKYYKIKHFIFASTSSVYGNLEKYPLKEEYPTDSPIQLYAATKKSNEVIAHSYSAMHKLKVSVLRFFTVYGPWGRPDMALFSFTKNIIEKKNINIFNNGNHTRDFTFIDDIVQGIINLIIIKNTNKFYKNKNIPFAIFNLANGNKVKLMDYISCIEKELEIKSKKTFLPLQIGDIKKTHGSIKKAKKLLNYYPKTNYKIGIKKFIKWYRDYYLNNVYKS
jgi:UDP-glucuronate 4-epimerase